MGPVVEKHTSRKSVDPRSEIATAVEHVEFSHVSRPQAERVFDASDPRNWARFGPQIFKLSEHGSWNSGVWTPEVDASAADQKWIAGRGGLIRELVEWDWNGNFACGAENILEFHDFEKKDDGVNYRYRLHHCIRAKLLADWKEGGIDVDEGELAVRFTEGDGGHLTVDASKSLRFANQPGIPSQLVTMLNLLSPMWLGTFMRLLTFDGARCALEDSPDYATRRNTAGFSGYEFVLNGLGASGAALREHGVQWSADWRKVRRGRYDVDSWLRTLAKTVETQRKLVRTVWSYPPRDRSR